MQGAEDVAGISGKRKPKKYRCVVCVDMIPPAPEGHSFAWPKDENRSDKFCEALNVPKAELPKFGSVSARRICSKHYSEEEMKKMKSIWLPVKGVIPSLLPRGWQKQPKVTSRRMTPSTKS